MSRRLLCSKSRTEKFRYLYDTPDVPTIQRIGQGWTVSSVREALKYYFAGFFSLTLFAPAYLSISKDRGGHIVPPLSILGLGGVRVPILFGHDLPMND